MNKNKIPPVTSRRFFYYYYFCDAHIFQCKCLSEFSKKKKKCECCFYTHFNRIIIIIVKERHTHTKKICSTNTTQIEKWTVLTFYETRAENFKIFKNILYGNDKWRWTVKRRRILFIFIKKGKRRFVVSSNRLKRCWQRCCTQTDVIVLQGQQLEKHLSREREQWNVPNIPNNTTRPVFPLSIDYKYIFLFYPFRIFICAALSCVAPLFEYFISVQRALIWRIYCTTITQLYRKKERKIRILKYSPQKGDRRHDTPIIIKYSIHVFSPFIYLLWL